MVISSTVIATNSEASMLPRLRNVLDPIPPTANAVPEMINPPATSKTELRTDRRPDSFCTARTLPRRMMGRC